MAERGIHLFDVENMPFEPAKRRPTTTVTDEEHRAQSAGVEHKWLIFPEPGADRPPVVIVKFPPNYRFPQHWHSEGEFIVVLEGTMTIGGHEAGPGAMAWTDANTVYGAEAAGPDGVEFLLFRRAFATTTLVEEQ
ncbi:cupin domain-containing protein [Nocardia sp. alder85J]|uniref:cupin domain-containing protein n=1 Tax=Nocardia sp. alder85J TaxID=2862949 RepID=UPI001CD652C3|nr:cupin domain-containing protein [Nocardia sp. alder85J]MCX4095679.1 cupin domain-containing protein [Nocardia sp. alder85J]